MSPLVIVAIAVSISFVLFFVVVLVRGIGREKLYNEIGQEFARASGASLSEAKIERRGMSCLLVAQACRVRATFDETVHVSDSFGQARTTTYASSLWLKAEYSSAPQWFEMSNTRWKHVIVCGGHRFQSGNLRAALDVFEPKFSRQIIDLVRLAELTLQGARVKLTMETTNPLVRSAPGFTRKVEHLCRILPLALNALPETPEDAIEAFTQRTQDVHLLVQLHAYHGTHGAQRPRAVSFFEDLLGSSEEPAEMIVHACKILCAPEHQVWSAKLIADALGDWGHDDALLRRVMKIPLIHQVLSNLDVQTAGALRLMQTLLTSLPSATIETNKGARALMDRVRLEELTTKLFAAYPKASWAAFGWLNSAQDIDPDAFLEVYAAALPREHPVEACVLLEAFSQRHPERVTLKHIQELTPMRSLKGQSHMHGVLRAILKADPERFQDAMWTDHLIALSTHTRSGEEKWMAQAFSHWALAQHYAALHGIVHDPEHVSHPLRGWLKPLLKSFKQGAQSGALSVSPPGQGGELTGVKAQEGALSQKS